MTRRSEGGEHFAKMNRQSMETPAWRALSLPAQAIYPWLKLEWKGPRNNNNGKIQLSLRQIAERTGCDPKTAMRALHDLQRKGWVVVKSPACLGAVGEARSHRLELTEIACPPETRPRALYRDWRPGLDLPVAEVRCNNPEGMNGKRNPMPSRGTRRSSKGHEERRHVPPHGTARSAKGHEAAPKPAMHVPSKGTSLSTRGLGDFEEVVNSRSNDDD